MALDDITGDAEEQYDEERLAEHIEKMDEHIEELERLQDMIVAFDSRLERLEDRLTMLERTLMDETDEPDDDVQESTDSFLEGEEEENDTGGHSWR